MNNQKSDQNLIFGFSYGRIWSDFYTRFWRLRLLPFLDSCQEFYKNTNNYREKWLPLETNHFLQVRQFTYTEDYNRGKINQVTEVLRWLKICHATLLHPTVVINNYWLKKRIFYASVPISIFYSESISFVIITVVTVAAVAVHYQQLNIKIKNIHYSKWLFFIFSMFNSPTSHVYST